MTRDQILSELRAGLLAAGFVAVDDLSHDEEIFVRVHSGETETDDTPLTHVNFAPHEITLLARDADAMHRRMIDNRIAGAVQCCRERIGAIRRAEVEKQAESDRLAAIEQFKEDSAANLEAFRAEQQAQRAVREYWAEEMERAKDLEPIYGAAVWDSGISDNSVWGA